MNPILSHLKNMFAQNRIMEAKPELMGLAKADSTLAELVHDKKVPGLSITVLKEGEVLLQKGYGYAHLELKKRMDPQHTQLRIASVSKPITATALAHLVADGVMDLDASFYDYVPNYPKKRWDFTIRQLAGHTAGIRGYQGKEYALNKPYSIKESIAIFKDDPLVFEPGKGYRYNSFDFVLLSLAMQEASGIPFEDYVQEKVLKPLGMENTIPEMGTRGGGRDGDNPGKIVVGRSSTTRSPTRPEPLGSQNYTRFRFGFREAVPVNNFYKLAGGGYLSTSWDIAKLGQAYLDGKVLDPLTLAPFLTSQMVGGNPTYYGLGWQVSMDGTGRKYYGHIGSSVGAYSNFFVYPEEKVVISILINCTDPKVQGELDVAIGALLDNVIVFK